MDEVVARLERLVVPRTDHQVAQFARTRMHRLRDGLDAIYRHEAHDHRR